VDEVQPPTGAWALTWRLAAALAASAVVFAVVAPHRTRDGLTLDLALGVISFVLVLGRRRWPVAVTVALCLANAYSASSYGPWLLAFASLSTRRRWPEIVGAGLLTMASGSAYAWLTPSARLDPFWVVPLLDLAFTACIAAWGMYVGTRREVNWSLVRRAEVAEAERDLRASRARLEERSQIAREMHDVLAHRISQITVHAGVLSYRRDLTDDEVHETAGVIRESAHQALTELRSILGVLRGDAVVRLQAPQPTYADLAELVAEAVDAGMRVTCTDRLPATPPVPDAAGRTLYRIVQEGITNARKHAPGAEVEICLDGSPERGITLTLRNAIGFGRALTPGSGLGLVGLAERAELSGGRLEAGREDDDFVMTGWIPWTP
jgi:signal transduction histidine kinase